MMFGLIRKLREKDEEIEKLTLRLKEAYEEKYRYWRMYSIVEDTLRNKEEDFLEEKEAWQKKCCALYENYFALYENYLNLLERYEKALKGVE